MAAADADAGADPYTRREQRVGADRVQQRELPARRRVLERSAGLLAAIDTSHAAADLAVLALLVARRGDRVDTLGIDHVIAAEIELAAHVLRDAVEHRRLALGIEHAVLDGADRERAAG